MASSASSRASISSARASSRSTWASDPSASSWIPVRAPETPKPAVTAWVYRSYTALSSRSWLPRAPVRAQFVRTVEEPVEPVGDAGREAAGIGDGVVLVQSQRGERGIGASGLLFQCGGICAAGLGGLDQGGSAFGLEGGDSGGYRRPHFFVRELQMPQPCHVLGRVDRGEAPESQQRDDGHHQQRDLRAYGPGAQGPASTWPGRLLRQQQTCVPFGALVGRRSRVRAASARRWRGTGPGGGRRSPRAAPR
jgi:hypothetical protein